MRYLHLLVATIFLAGCASSTPTVQMGPNAEISFDGLHRVDNSQNRYVWVKPGFSLEGYNKVRLVGAGIEYRAVKPVKGVRANSGRTEFPLDEKQRARLEEVVREVFIEELGKSKYFAIVADEGADVLELKGALLDVFSSVPPEPMGRGDIYISKIGEATLLVELRDSQSEEILARTIDRRAFQPTTVQRSSRPMNVAEVRRELRRWASRLTESLDALHESGMEGSE